jgi:hypothetical protein
MDLLEQSLIAPDGTEATAAAASTSSAATAPGATAPNASEAPTVSPLEPGDDALLGLPPGVSAPENVETVLSPAVAQQVQWYHLDPSENYQELRLGEGPGIYRGLAFGGLLSILAIGLFYGCMWLVEPSAGLLNPFIDRTYSEARDEIAIHLGGLAPMAATPGAPGTTQPTSGGRTFDMADLRSAHRASPNGDGMNGATTWYRFDLPRDQVPLYREHLVKAWLNALKHRVEDGGGDPAFDKTGAPPFWDSTEFDDGTRLRLIQSNGDVAFQAAFSSSRGRVYIRVNH